MITPDQTIIQTATKAQAKAANPQASVWLAANAGTGKTYVLVQRLIRLLVNDPQLNPAAILALTYTNAAAQEMRDRLIDKVTPWSYMPPEILQETLTSILHRTPTNVELETAQKLPLRLRSQNINAMTIHSFCQKVLQRFPIEAGLPPHFTLWANEEPKDALKQAQTQAIQNLSHPDHSKHWAFHFITTQAGDQKLKDLMEAYITYRDKIQTCLEDETFDATLKHNLSLPEQASTEELIHEKDLPIQPSETFVHFMNQYGEFFKTGTATSQKWIARFEEIQALKRPEERDFSDLFLTKQGAPKAASSIAAKSVMANLPDHFPQLLQTEQARFEHPKNIYTYLFTKAFIDIGQETEACYAALKQQAGAVDFNELIQRTEKLLYNTDLKDWVRYRLDGGVKHLLLDETQDTNPIQWRIVKALMADFFTGDGQHEHTPRTLFAVGDFKQSIYRFQGAETKVFEDIKTFLTQAKTLGYTTETEATLNTSFRSVPSILNAVDDVFTQPLMATYTSMTGQEINHISARTQQPGRVELWPPVAVPESEQQTPWTMPQHRPQTSTADSLLCAEITTEIKRLIQSDALQDALIVKDHTGNATHRRTPQLNDFLLLIQSRGILAELTSALTAENIPFVAPNPSDPKDTFNLPIPRDLKAILEFIHQPENDIALLTTLRSPLFSYSEESLLTLVQSRLEGKSLFNSLSPEHDVRQCLTPLLSLSTPSPYTLLITLNQRFNLTQYLAQNMGGSSHAVKEAQLVYQSFLQAAQSHKTLTSFLISLTEHGLNIIRPEVAEDTQPAVRIMTVHGAKGLESPIVFLVDAGKNIFKSGKTPALSWEEGQFIVRQSQSEGMCPSYQKHLDAIEKENTLKDSLRLLYVAMTRASEKLYICAALQKTGLKDAEALKERESDTNIPKTWWGIIANAAEKSWELVAKNSYLKAADTSVALPQAELQTQRQAHNIETPSWLTDIFSTPEKTAETNTENTAAQQEGTRLHKAIELFATQSPAAAHQYLDHNKEDITLLSAIHQHLPWVFEQGQSEVPLLTPTTKGLEKRVIDRLIITPNTITIVDFKSDHIIPDTLPTKYRKQLSIYEKAIKEMYPSHHITSGIAWIRAMKNDQPAPFFQEA